jgi:hypothetical protein
MGRDCAYARKSAPMMALSAGKAAGRMWIFGREDCGMLMSFAECL